MTKAARGRSRGTAGGALCLLALLALSPAPSPAEDLEAGVKAAYIYNFTQFVEWETPASTAAPAGPFSVCVLGEGPVASALGALEGRKAGKAAIKVTRYKEAARLPYCRILFISRSAEKGMAGTLGALGHGTLTVSDIPGFARKGGIIGFFMDDKKVRIEVDPRRAGAAGLKLSPRLLQVSKIIGDPR
jgi:hypothetical protein